MKIDVITLDGAAGEALELRDDIFGIDEIRADILQHRRWITRGAGDGDRRIVDIGGEDRKFRPTFQRRARCSSSRMAIE